MTTRTYIAHNDPGHGWLGVPMKDLFTLGIADAITPYSYLNDGIAYLEEDCDYTTFIVSAEAAGWKVKVTHVHEDPTPIRSYRPYPALPEYRKRMDEIAGDSRW